MWPLELLLGLNLPIYILLDLFLSYLVWSKFLKEGKLYPKEIDDIMDMLIIFFFISMMFVIFPLLVLIVLRALNFEFNILNDLRETPYLLAYIAILLLLLIVPTYYRKEVSRIDLKEPFIWIFL